MKIQILCFGMFLPALSVFACINIVGTKFNGESKSSGGLTGVRMIQYALKSNPKPDGIKMEAELRGSTNFTDRSDYSAALMFVGRYQEAIHLLESLEKEKPGEYYVAGNLGTAYELCGDNESALHWIKEEINRNPDAHEGTEWLHVKILEAKIAQQKDPDYFKKHSVLELDPRQMSDDQDQNISVNNTPMPVSALSEAITHQLSERLKFVKPPDAPVASLLFDYAAIEARFRTLESAKAVLQMALDYGYPADKIQPLLQYYDKKIFWRKLKGDSIYAVGFVLFVLLLAILYKRGIFVLSSKDLKTDFPP